MSQFWCLIYYTVASSIVGCPSSTYTQLTGFRQHSPVCIVFTFFQYGMYASCRTHPIPSPWVCMHQMNSLLLNLLCMVWHHFLVSSAQRWQHHPSLAGTVETECCLVQSATSLNHVSRYILVCNYILWLDKSYTKFAPILKRTAISHVHVWSTYLRLMISL